MIVIASASTIVPKGFADPMRDDFGVMHRSEDASQQGCACEGEQNHPGELLLMTSMTQAATGTATLQTGTLLNNLQFIGCRSVSAVRRCTSARRVKNEAFCLAWADKKAEA